MVAGAATVFCLRNSLHTMMPALAVPSFAGKGSYFARYEQHVISRNRIASVEPDKKAAALILQMHHVARQVCVAGGEGRIINNDGAQQTLRISRDRLAPDAVNAIYRGVC